MSIVVHVISEPGYKPGNVILFVHLTTMFYVCVCVYIHVCVRIQPTMFVILPNWDHNIHINYFHLKYIIILKCAKDLNRHFPEDTQTASKHMKPCSKSLVIGKTQVKTTNEIPRHTHWDGHIFFNGKYQALARK